MTHSTFACLHDFIDTQMSMSHIYQPVMLITLLDGQGQADKQTLARAILSYDQSQIDYYKQIVSTMPRRVLRGHQLVSPGPRGSGLFFLNGFDALTPDEIETLKQLCLTKLDEYIEKRGQKIWAHRNYVRNAIPGSDRFTVLKRAELGDCTVLGDLIQILQTKPNQFRVAHNVWWWPAKIGIYGFF